MNNAETCRSNIRIFLCVKCAFSVLRMNTRQDARNKQCQNDTSAETSLYYVN